MKVPYVRQMVRCWLEDCIEETFGFKQSSSTLTQGSSTSPKNHLRAFPIYRVACFLLLNMPAYHPPIISSSLVGGLKYFHVFSITSMLLILSLLSVSLSINSLNSSRWRNHRIRCQKLLLVAVSFSLFFSSSLLLSLLRLIILFV